MDIQSLTPEQLLGPLNEVEKLHAPRELFTAGDTEILNHGPRVSIVGARKASREGIARARKLAGRLTERGAVVVSGLAEGIDTAAHISCLSKGGRTVAVIGTPLNEFYPKSNTELQKLLMREHLVVSQFPVSSPIQRRNFPLRNRTMALLSDATVIIEASNSSGSLSQGWEALRLGRLLFITKALVEDKSLTWPSEMLDYGAKVLTDENFEQFLEMLPPRIINELDAALPF